MAIKKDKKIEILKDLKKIVKDSQSLVFVNFKGLSVSLAGELREVLKNAGVKYLVAKKTLTKMALVDSKTSGEIPELPGEIALAFGDDLLAPAREIEEFSRRNPGKLTILGGIFEGKYKNQSEMMQIATIPTLPILQGKFVNIINSPIQRFAIALKQIAEKNS